MPEVKGRPSSQDISWFLDLHRQQRLDLNPPYQRKSVWTSKDRRFFLDTIFRNYPCPPIYLHKTTEEDDKHVYHVVDGKQRLETIILFTQDKLRIPKTFGDKRLEGKKWSDLDGKTDLKERFWNYCLTVEMLNSSDGILIENVFDRLNRNSRKLTPQELRHAKFDGWFITLVEAEAEKSEWEDIGIVTTARAKRMADVQFISELLLVLIDGQIAGFDQDALDEKYADYEEEPELPKFSEKKFLKRLNEVKAYVSELEENGNAVTEHATGFGNFYSLWAVVVLSEKLPSAEKFAERYSAFMKDVELIADQKYPDQFYEKHKKKDELKCAFRYYQNTQGANTDLPQREERFKALAKAVLD